MEWNFQNNLPIYSQLVTQIRRAIASGQLEPGEKLPSVRELAVEAGVNPNTVQRAFQELERTGLIVTQRNSGRYVTDETEGIGDTRWELARKETGEYLHNMARLGFSRQEIIERIQTFTEEENNGTDLCVPQPDETVR